MQLFPTYPPRNLQKSKRGELEITSVIQNYIDDDDIDAKNLSINFRWFDTGETNKLIEASNYIKKKQHEKNEIIPCIEYLLYLKKFINKKQLNNLIKSYPNSTYKSMLLRDFTYSILLLNSNWLFLSEIEFIIDNIFFIKSLFDNSLLEPIL